MIERRPLATLRLHHDALNLSVFHDDNVHQRDVVEWLFSLGQQFAWLGIFCSTVASEIQKGEHGTSSVLVCYARETRG